MSRNKNVGLVLSRFERVFVKRRNTNAIQLSAHGEHRRMIDVTYTKRPPGKIDSRTKHSNWTEKEKTDRLHARVTYKRFGRFECADKSNRPIVISNCRENDAHHVLRSNTATTIVAEVHVISVTKCIYPRAH